jgi:CRP-like cAMP-binding protein
MPNKKNELFARLSLVDFHQVERHIRTIELQQGSVLADTHQPIQSVYFPHSGIISCVVETKNGDTIETGMMRVRRGSGV